MYRKTQGHISVVYIQAISQNRNENQTVRLGIESKYVKISVPPPPPPTLKRMPYHPNIFIADWNIAIQTERNLGEPYS